MTEEIKRFCTACQCDKPAQGGSCKTGKVTRWICEGCLERMASNLSNNATKKKEIDMPAKGAKRGKPFELTRPHRLFDHIRLAYKIQSDASLSQILEVSPSIISRIRSRKIKISAELILKIYDITDLPIQSIRELSR